MKKKMILMSIAAILFITSCVGGALAFFSATSDQTKNNITTENLSVKLVEEGKEAEPAMDKAGTDLSFIMPGDTVEYSLAGTNDGYYDLYLRVRLTKYWVDGSSEKVTEADAGQIALLTDDNMDSNWIIWDDDEYGEEITMFYRYPLKAGESTSSLFNALQIGNIPSTEQHIYAGLTAHLQADADAIQVVGAKDAMMDEWGLDVTIGSDGRLESVEE
ncbi:hypothetical protein [Lachnotalea sp. AF33-28]|uniref:hypothetical protein n=1 Tax=Lachnotalea sp. AF33-28 TaxID=2292046 RepID=UPI000E4D6021|nr:hypothetical protein [Lachnotalea sp. AF33-28]RHP36367.1 hypothetical protein DWZ56_01610 [Lachnotalea sp. AF33-28]